jgi:hypothetical protein
MPRQMVSPCRLRRALSLALLVGFSVAVAGCGASGGGTGAAGTSTAGTGASGPYGTLVVHVEASPTCPVERVDHPCPPLLIAHRRVTIETPSGAAAATATTNAQGQFSVSLAPGAYVVRVAIVAGMPGLRQVTPGQVAVVAGETTAITIELDTGIR